MKNITRHGCIGAAILAALLFAAGCTGPTEVPKKPDNPSPSPKTDSTSNKNVYGSYGTRSSGGGSPTGGTSPMPHTVTPKKDEVTPPPATTKTVTVKVQSVKTGLAGHKQIGVYPNASFTEVSVDGISSTATNAALVSEVLPKLRAKIAGAASIAEARVKFTKDEDAAYNESAIGEAELTSGIYVSEFEAELSVPVKSINPASATHNTVTTGGYSTGADKSTDVTIDRDGTVPANYAAEAIKRLKLAIAKAVHSTISEADALKGFAVYTEAAGSTEVSTLDQLTNPPNSSIFVGEKKKVKAKVTIVMKTGGDVTLASGILFDAGRRKVKNPTAGGLIALDNNDTSQSDEVYEITDEIMRSTLKKAVNKVKGVTSVTVGDDAGNHALFLKATPDADGGGYLPVADIDTLQESSLDSSNNTLTDLKLYVGLLADS